MSYQELASYFARRDFEIGLMTKQSTVYMNMETEYGHSFISLTGPNGLPNSLTYGCQFRSLAESIAVLQHSNKESYINNNKAYGTAETIYTT